MHEAQDQDDVVSFLLRPESYGCKEPVQRIDTHAAIIFLVGEHAYKLKRAVAYGYLDFSTVEKRKAVCEAELRLNLRTAPELYLEVRSVNRDANGSLGFGEGEPVDWLVVMRRFPADDLLLAVAERGELKRSILLELADRIAAFHDTARVTTDPKGAARVRKVIVGNKQSMDALEPGALPVADCEALSRQSLARLEEISSLLERRSQSSHVRHCHGDLHLANICLWHGRPLLFDCLEFSEELATTDVLYDLAFLLMDLWQRGFRDEANLVFNRYLDMRDETAGISAMPLFLSMRAAVRAHVAATAAAGIDDSGARTRKLEEARGYLEAALGFLGPPMPRLVAVGGLSGTGKSTLAGSLAPHFGAAPGARWLRTDVLRKRLAGVAPETKLAKEAYSKACSSDVYRRLMEQAHATIKAGHSVIVDGVFARPEERAAIAAESDRAGVPFLGLWLDAPRHVLIERVTGRSGDASDADAAVVESQLDYDLGTIAPWSVIDASGSRRTALEQALAAIKA